MSFHKKKNIAEINVVPFIDVMLVLLVIFMVRAPLMFNGINLKLPKTKKVNKVQFNKDQVVLSFTKAGEYYIGKQKFLFTELIDELRNQLSVTNNRVVFLRADFGLQYGNVANLIGQLKRGGINEVSLVTQIQGSDE